MEVDVGADVVALVSIAFAAGIDSHINALSPVEKRLRSIFLKKKSNLHHSMKINYALKTKICQYYIASI